MSKKIKFCCICGAPLEGFGNNPWGAAWKDEKGNVIFPEFEEGDRCCNVCDNMYVIPGRIYQLQESKKTK